MSDVDAAEYQRLAQRAAAALIAEHALPTGTVSYDILVRLVALGWLEGRMAAEADLRAALLGSAS